MELITPTGRLVSGNLYKLFDNLDDNNKPKLNADGTKSQSCRFGLAIPKKGEQIWWQTEWGAKIYQVGAAAYPAECQSPRFAWKITDGDSTVPNGKGKKPCDNENFRGCWVLWFSQGWLPKVCNADGSVELPTPDLVKPGYYIRVLADVIGNAPAITKGIYLNPKAVAFMGEGDVIASDTDTTAFAAGATEQLPPGARPVAAAVPGFGGPATPPPPGAAAPAPAPLPAAPAPAPAPAPTPAPTPTPTPGAALPPQNPNFLHAGSSPPAPPTPQKRMTAKAGATTYEQFVAGGWTDAQMIAEGYLSVA